MKRRFTEDSWRREPWFQSLVLAFRCCSSDVSMENFLRDIATLSELKALAERLEIAKLLGKGLSYRQVSAITQASTTTVARVAAYMENGEGGYREILKVHRHHEVRKKLALHEGEKLTINLKEQILSTKKSIEPNIKGKSGVSNRQITALQKYLQK